jgi:hypothetical protein
MRPDEIVIAAEQLDVIFETFPSNGLDRSFDDPDMMSLGES